MIKKIIEYPHTFIIDTDNQYSDITLCHHVDDEENVYMVDLSVHREKCKCLVDNTMTNAMKEYLKNNVSILYCFYKGTGNNTCEKVARYDNIEGTWSANATELGNNKSIFIAQWLNNNMKVGV